MCPTPGWCRYAEHQNAMMALVRWKNEIMKVEGVPTPLMLKLGIVVSKCSCYLPVICCSLLVVCCCLPDICQLIACCLLLFACCFLLFCL